MVILLSLQNNRRNLRAGLQETLGNYGQGTYARGPCSGAPNSLRRQEKEEE